MVAGIRGVGVAVYASPRQTVIAGAARAGGCGDRGSVGG